jgi:hypothetical protein
MAMSVPSEVKISGMDLAKDVIKQALWNLPTPLSLVAFKMGCSVGLFNKYFLLYDKMGRPPGVMSGPLQGVAFLPLTRGSAPIPKVLGTYEKELHPIIERLGKEPCDVLIDVGSAEGYYAVGLSKKFGIHKVYCFDLDSLAKRLLLRIAGLNGVTDRMIMKSFCRPADLQEIMKEASHPLLVCDCEGGEVELLDPEAAPELEKARILVEVHDYNGAHAVGDGIKRKFSATHDIETIGVQPRTLADVPAACRNTLTDEEGLNAMNEYRGDVPGWFYLRPKAGQQG